MKSLRAFLILISIGSVLTLTSCGEKAATGTPTAIPRIFINCTTTRCLSNRSPTVFVSITTSSCANPVYGGAVSASTNSISCNGTTGCYGEVTSWQNSEGNATTQIPSGTYTVCGLIDFNRDYPAISGDEQGELDNVNIQSGTAIQFITSWFDL